MLPFHIYVGTWPFLPRRQTLPLHDPGLCRPDGFRQPLCLRQRRCRALPTTMSKMDCSFGFLAATGADLVKKEIEDGVVVKIYLAAVGARVCLTPMAFATVRSGEPLCPRRTGNKDAAVFGVRWIMPESTVSPVREMVWK